jgi:iron complex outermembrane receptor protein
MNLKLLIFVLIVSSSLMAQELDDLSLQELMNVSVESVSKKDEKLINAPSNVHVITRKQLLAWGSRSLKDVMRRVPGFQVIADRDEWVFASRGNTSDNNTKYLILIDGKRMNSSENFGPGQIIEAPFDMSIVKKIEIIRGPGSAVWGADALAGVISITTITYDDISRNGLSSVTIGTEDTYKGNLVVGEKVSDNAQWILMFNYIQSSGKNIKQDRPGSTFSTPSDRNEDVPTSLDRQTPSYNLYLKSHVGKFKINAFHFNTHTFNRQFENDQGRDMQLATEKSFIEGIYNLKTDLTWRLGWASDQQEYQPTNTTQGKSIIWKSNSLTTNIDGTSNISDLWSLNYGSEFSLDRQGPNPNLDQFKPDGTSTATEAPKVISQANMSDESLGAYLMANLQLTNDLTFVLGSRFDYNNDRGQKGDELVYSPRFATIYQLNPSNTFKLLYNQGFLRPNNFTNTSKPTGDKVKSERMRQYEAQWLASLGKSSIITTIFHQKLAGFVNIRGDQSAFLNAGDYESNGIEVEYKQSLNSSSELWLNASYADAEGKNFESNIYEGDKRVDRNGHLLSYAPYTINSGIDYNVNSFTLAPALRYLSPTRYRSLPVSATAAELNNTGLYLEKKTKALYLFDFNLSYDTNNWRYNFLIDNILDERGPTHMSIWNGEIDMYGRYMEIKATYKF